MGVVVTTNGDRQLAEVYCAEIERELWSLRQDFVFRNMSVAEGIKLAGQNSAYPFVIVDSSDNVGGGSSGDGTEVLAEMIKQELGSCVVIIRDIEAVEIAEKAGVGGFFKLPVGGKTDHKHGSPVYVEGQVTKISSGCYHSERTGEEVRMGKTAVIDINGITLILTAQRAPAFDLETLYSLGLNPEKLKYIVVKGAVQWRISYGAIAGGWVEVDAQGVTSSDLRRFDFKNVRRPIFPLDGI